MPHIHTEPGQHDHTVSIYLFRTDLNEPKVMLHLHRKVGGYSQFGGHIELNENPWQSAVHELKEETGYDIDQVEILQPKERMISITGAILHPYPVAHATMQYPVNDGHLHTDSVYAFVTNERPHDTPEEGESTYIKLFSRSELISQGKGRIDRITYDIALYIFDNILNNWQPTSPSNFK